MFDVKFNKYQYGSQFTAIYSPHPWSQVFPVARSQSQVIISHIYTAIFLDAINDKNIIWTRALHFSKKNIFYSR